MSGETIHAFLTQHLLPGVFGARLRVVAQMVMGIILADIADYANVARESPSLARRAAAAIKRYFRLCHLPLRRLRLLQDSLIHLMASQAKRRVVIAVDWTDVQGFCVLVFAVAIGRRTVPIYWVSAPWHADHLRIEKSAFTELRELLPSGLEYILLGDRGFGTTRNLELLKSLDFQFVLRTKASRILIRRVEKSETFVAIERITCPRGKPQDLGKIDFTASHSVRIRLVRFWDFEQKAMWVLATNLDVPAITAVRLYSLRFLIEETFRDLKDVRSGWQIGGSTVKTPLALSWLFGYATLAYIITTAIGLDAEARNWHTSYQSNNRSRELAPSRLGRMVARDDKRGARYCLDRLNQSLRHLGLKLGHWDWKPRPHEAEQDWETTPLPTDQTDSRGVREPRKERPCELALRHRLSDLFGAKKITQHQVAAAVDRTRGQVSSALQGGTSLPRHWIPNIAALLEMTTEELIGDTGWTGSERKGSREGRELPRSEKRRHREKKAKDAQVATDVPADTMTAEEAQRASLLSSLRRACKEKRITQSALGKAIGTTQSVVSALLRGKYKKDHPLLQAMCDHVGLCRQGSADDPTPGVDSPSPAEPDQPESIDAPGEAGCSMATGTAGTPASTWSSTCAPPPDVSPPSRAGTEPPETGVTPVPAKRKIRAPRYRHLDHDLIRRLNLEFKHRGMTQTQLAQLLGCGQGTVSLVLRGKVGIQTRWLPAIYELVGVEAAGLATPNLGDEAMEGDTSTSPRTDAPSAGTAAPAGCPHTQERWLGNDPAEDPVDAPPPLARAQGPVGEVELQLGLSDKGFAHSTAHNAYCHKDFKMATPANPDGHRT